ncbi:MAG: hypothetical protein QM619_06385 [Micropruina sp.]|uniref:YveK family protein n=1 Tax=Micropruina sp. TaxID=2737536 RepID=UPI0039E460AB
MAEALSMQELGTIARRHWLILAALVAVGAVGGYLGARALPPTYTAMATSLVKGIPGTDSTANYQAAQYAISRARTYPIFVDSLPVLEAVRSDLGDTATIEDLQVELAASNPIDTPLVQVTAEAGSADGARDMANSAARHLARYITQIETVNGSSPVTVEVAVQATSPRSPTTPRPALIAGLGAFSAGCLGLVGLVMFDRIGRPLVSARRLRHPNEKLGDDPLAVAAHDDEPEPGASASRTGAPARVRAPRKRGSALDPPSSRTQV